MLSEYTRYIENIRNGLIQCGVIFPQIDDIEEAEYGDLFYIGEKLNDIMYFYKIMVCSGNIEEMFLPMDKSYRGTVRLEAFSEFEEDILPLLKEQFGDEDNDSFDLQSICDVDGVVGDVEEEPEVWVNEDVAVEDTLIDVNDLFGDDDEEVHVADQFIATGASLWGAGSEQWLEVPDLPDDISREFVSEGTDIFNITVPTIDKQKQDPVSYVPNGIELFSIVVSKPDKETGEDVWVDEEPEEVLWEDDSEDVWGEDSEDIFENGSEIWEDEIEDMGSAETNPEDIWESEDDSEDIFENNPEEIWEDEEDFPQESADPFEVNPDDVWVADESDSWDEDAVEDGNSSEEENHDIVWNTDDSDDTWDAISDDFGNEEEMGNDSPVLSKPIVASTPKTQQSPVIDPNYERDIVDTVQEAASAALTSAKKFLINLTTPKKK